jgi:branched-chain amino acid transport system substrate-binding protein
VLAALAAGPAGCKRERAAAGDGTSGPIKIGGIFDLSGPTADVGTFYAEGIKGYVEWKNAQGGVRGRPIELLSADYGYKVDRAEALYSQFVQEGVVAFQGWGTGDTEALRGKVAADKVPYMSASYSAGLLDLKQAPYNFLVGTSYSDQAVIALRWALDEWKAAGKSGQPKVAMVHHDSPFGESPVADARAFAHNHGMEFTSMAMPKGATDYVAELAQLRQFGASHVIVHTVSSPATVLIKGAKSQGLHDTMTFINLVWCADEVFIRLAGDAAEGVIGALPFTPPSVPVTGARDAAELLKSKGTSLADKGLHYTQGWWTMAIMAAGIERVIDGGEPVTGERIRAALETLTEFATGGVTPPISFTPQSHKGNAALRLYRVEGGRWKALTDFVSASP